MEKKCIIAGAGDFFEKSLEIGENDLLIAADGGLDSLLKIGAEPSLYIGDRDSSKSDKKIIDSIFFPVKKDDSDTLLAIKEGLKRGYSCFYIFGGTGGRIDHTMANIKALEFLTERNSTGFLFFERQVMTVIKNSSIHLPKEFKGYFSIFPTGGEAKGVTIEGGEYLLQNATLESSCSMGLSNEFKGEDVLIKVQNGSLAVIFERQGKFI